MNRFRAYVAVTGVVFLFMFAAHVARVFAEGPGILHEPIIILTTLLSVGVAVWALLLLIGRPRGD
jgi:hypothetical protein